LVKKVKEQCYIDLQKIKDGDSGSHGGRVKKTVSDNYMSSTILHSM